MKTAYTIGLCLWFTILPFGANYAKDADQGLLTQTKNPFDPIQSHILTTPVEQLSENKTVIHAGAWLFQTYCSHCHGEDGTGKLGFPNLTDNDWLHGGKPADIKRSITEGQYGNMPAHGGTLTETQIETLAGYIKTGLRHDAPKADEANTLFQHYCANCHKVDGTGNTHLGAPDLTDNVWLYGNKLEDIKISIKHGGNGWMPDFDTYLTDVDIQLLTAYVFHLSREE